MGDTSSILNLVDGPLLQDVKQRTNWRVRNVCLEYDQGSSSTITPLEWYWKQEEVKEDWGHTEMVSTDEKRLRCKRENNFETTTQRNRGCEMAAHAKRFLILLHRLAFNPFAFLDLSIKPIHSTNIVRPIDDRLGSRVWVLPRSDSNSIYTTNRLRRVAQRI